MPRGRPRKRLSRMDAAVDAMAPFGFPEDQVKRVAKELLKEYGGPDEWHFIEDCAYKELIDAILRDVEENDQDKVAEYCDKSEDKSSFNDDEGASSSRASATQQDEILQDNVPPPVVTPIRTVLADESRENIIQSEINGKRWKDILANEDRKTELQSPANNVIPTSPSLGSFPSSPPAKSLPAPRRKFPCYGWIESDDEEPCDFVSLKPEPKLVEPKLVERRRRSRWDQKPDGS